MGIYFVITIQPGGQPSFDSTSTSRALDSTTNAQKFPPVNTHSMPSSGLHSVRILATLPGLAETPRISGSWTLGVSVLSSRQPQTHTTYNIDGGWIPVFSSLHFSCFLKGMAPDMVSVRTHLVNALYQYYGAYRRCISHFKSLRRTTLQGCNQFLLGGEWFYRWENLVSQ